MKSADVAVIGGGCMGISIAYNLKRPGIEKVMLLEKGLSPSHLRQIQPELYTDDLAGGGFEQKRRAKDYKTRLAELKKERDQLVSFISFLEQD